MTQHHGTIVDRLSAVGLEELNAGAALVYSARVMDAVAAHESA